jgi:hypothetical protein
MGQAGGPVADPQQQPAVGGQVLRMRRSSAPGPSREVVEHVEEGDHVGLGQHAVAQVADLQADGKRAAGQGLPGMPDGVACMSSP